MQRLTARERDTREPGSRARGIGIFLAAAILLIAPPAFPQHENSAAPNPENVLNPSTIQGFLARFSRPQTAQAAPPRPHRHIVRSTRKKSSPPPVVSAQAEPDIATPEATPDWPNAQDNLGINGIVPVVIKTVRELAEADAETSVVRESDLSDLDIAAAPPNRLANAIPETDGSATQLELEPQASRVFAFAENLKITGAYSWLEPILLMLAGAVAAFSAKRIFAA